MLMYPHIDPVALQIGPLAIHWYGLTYLAAFGLFMFLGTRRLRHEPFASLTGPGAWTRKDVEDILFLGVVGVVIGGRLGYCLFYKPGYYVTHPLEIFCRLAGRHEFPRRPAGRDCLHGLVCALAPAALAGRSTTSSRPACPRAWRQGGWATSSTANCGAASASPELPWGMVFPQSGSMLPRHPSQVYQFLLEGLLLFVLLWLYARSERRQGQVAAVFLFGYGVFRFIAEFFREPDGFLGLLPLGMSMGQWLCLPMIAAGVALWLWAQRQP